MTHILEDLTHQTVPVNPSKKKSIVGFLKASMECEGMCPVWNGGCP